MLAEAFQAHRVLIVDDQAIPRDLESFALEGTGRYLTLETGNGSDALNELARGDYDCAVIDLDMPDMSGLELITLIRRSNDFAKLPIVLVLPDRSGIIPDSRETVGATRVITKPFNPWDLAGLLDGIFGTIEDSPHFLSVEAVLHGFPYPTMILDAHHRVVLANGPFYEESSTGIGDSHLLCSDALHDDGTVPPLCPLDECVSTGQPISREIDTILGPVQVSVSRLSAQTGDGKPLYLHITQPL